MLILPIDVNVVLGHTLGGVVFFLIGSLFGASLEVAGFGDSRRLAAQFYLKDMTVLKTMFTAIVVACVLMFFSSALGIMDFSQIVVNQTYLWPGIVGGLIMGVGFVIGGYCPGTSMVSAASLKLDGILFFIGTLLGVGIFGESVGSFPHFWNSSFYDRFLLSDWLGWSIGATVFAVVVMAIVMFYFAEKSEIYFGGKKASQNYRTYIISAAIILIFATATWVLGQPSADRKWSLMADRYEKLLTEREVFIHPLEYVQTWHNAAIKLETLDLRTEKEFESFHLDGAKNTKLSDLVDGKYVNELLSLPGHGVVILVSDDEAVTVQAWKWLKAQGVANLFILDGGIKNWNTVFANKIDLQKKMSLTHPPLHILEEFPKETFKTKIKLKLKKAAGGLCS